MQVASEIARFRPDDPDELVHASFACSGCLCEPTHATVQLSSDSATVDCHCHRCGLDWRVDLTAEQSLRVQLRPPWAGMSTLVRIPGRQF
ncbi:hypothetical protein [Capillimicrobium parvum]|uniref:Uncharacterized protein n=1 Tax=Capillimicrobium parvum TaxID=2884022 RepID=A0A9E6Y0B7_9ACTN|nr:hypothetical protein [Capillimicrobium parvum]UGS37443.1 hypothetical protein DSM104329_03859 [Capillimicrobium parvum]